MEAFSTLHLISCRLVYDRETGKPKGYGFCEYQDVETAQSAMRNLNNYDFNGRPLRVGVAAGEQSKDEGKALQQALGGQIVEVSLCQGWLVKSKIYQSNFQITLQVTRHYKCPNTHELCLRQYFIIENKIKIV